jgi:hypothetical protein
MNERDVSGLYAILGLALAMTFGFGLWLIGGPTLRIVALIVGACGGVALLAVGAALVIRAWRKNDNPPAVIERHYTLERHTLDGRQIEAPKLYQLSAPPSGGAFPDLLRAAYQAGALRPQEPPVDGQARELSPDEWDGHIGGLPPQTPQG